jgi:hypothetical protein
MDNGQVLRLLNMLLEATYLDPSEAAIFNAASECSSALSTPVLI